MSIQFERPDISLKKHVIDGMRAAIVEGVFAPGQKLVERELCAMFDVSRSLIREALQKLEAEALITIVPHRGPMVALITPSEARSIYAVREALEALAGAGCARHASAADIAALEQALAHIKRCADDGNQHALVQAKNAFYDALLAACGNPVVQEILTGLNNRINALRRLSMSQPGRLPHTIAEIAAIISAIRHHDAPLAARRCAEHVSHAADTALHAMTQQTGEVPSLPSSEQKKHRIPMP